MQVTLEFFNRHGEIKPIMLDGDTIIGRGEQCDLKVGSELVSRQHCVLRIQSGQIVLEDLGSTNGTYVDGIRVESNSRVALKPGCELLIGPARARIKIDAAAESAVPPAHIVPQPAAAEPAVVPAESDNGTESDEPDSAIASRETVSNVSEMAAIQDDTVGEGDFPSAAPDQPAAHEEPAGDQQVAEAEPAADAAPMADASDDPRFSAIAASFDGGDNADGEDHTLFVKPSAEASGDEPDDDLGSFLQQFE